MRRITSLALVVFAVASMFVIGSANPAKAATFVVNTTSDASDETPGDGSCTIMEFATCSFRAALQEVTALGGTNTINFTIPGNVDNPSQAHVINVTGSPLPAIGSNTTIEAYQFQPGVWGRPKIVLQGSPGSGPGLFILGSNNSIRGLAIRNFPGAGIIVQGDGNSIQTMHIGSDASGNVNAGNGAHGIVIFDAANNNIEGNIIVGNPGHGVSISESGSTGNTLYNNSIGLGADGSSSIGNSGAGVYISGAGDNIIGAPNGPGGGFPFKQNDISSNGGNGIVICGSTSCGDGTPASGNRIENNMIGVRSFGAEDRGNNLDGIELDKAANTMIADNVISANGNFGIEDKNGSTGTRIQSNRVGTNAAGNSDLGNDLDGIRLVGASASVIDSNIVAGNQGYGIFLTGATFVAVLVRNEVGKLGIPNNAGGIANHSATNTAIGSSGVAGNQNTITHNLGTGIKVSAFAAGPNIDRNVIHSNGALGIDLGFNGSPPVGTEGVTPNETPENSSTPLNFPDLTNAEATDGNDRVDGTVDSYPDEDYRIDIYANDSCDASGHGEGQTWVGAQTVATDGTGATNFTFTTGQDLTGRKITATSTRMETGVTSEFSECETVVNQGGEEPLEGEIDLDITETEVGTSPTKVPFDHIPLQPQAPALETAPLDLKGLGILPLDLKGLGILPLDLKGLGILPLDLKGLGILPLDLKGLGILPLDLKGLGILPLDLKGLGILPAVEAALCSLTLADVAIDQGWDRILLGSTLAGKPLQTVRYCDLDAKHLTPQGRQLLEQTHVYQLGFANKLGDLSIYSALLGLTSINDINITSLDDAGGADNTWVERLDRLGFTCQQLTRPGRSSCLDTSLLELELAGVPLDVSEEDRFPRLHAIPYGAVDTTNAPIRKIKLDHIDMPNTNFGSIKIADLGANASAVVDDRCTNCVNLADAQQQDMIVDTATVAHLATTINGFSLGEVAFGVVPQAAAPFSSIPLTALGIETYDAEGSSNKAHFTVEFTPTNRQPDERATLRVTLPETFTYAANSADDPCTMECQDLEPEIDGSTLTFTAGYHVEQGQTYTLEFDAFTGLELGTFQATARVLVDDLDQTSEPDVVTVQDAFEPNNDLETATQIEPGHLYISHPSRDIYEFDAPDVLGSRVSVSLDHMSSDLDLVVCHPETAPPPGGAPFREPGAHQRAVALPDEGRGLVGDAKILPQAGDIPIPCEGLVAGVSAHRGTEGEFVETISTTTEGKFYVQVTKYFGEENSEGANGPYSLRVNVQEATGGQAWDPRVFLEDENPYDDSDNIGASPLPMNASTKTIILFNKSRISDDYGSTAANDLEAKLNTFAQHAAVNGWVLSVDAVLDGGVPVIRNLLQARDATPSPELNNQVIRRVLQEVDARLPGGDASGIENIVIVGGDEQFPMARLFDPTIKGNESGYIGDVKFTGNRNALTDSIGSGYYLSDAPYGTFSPRPFLDRFLYVPEISIGRLVETPADMIAQLDFFLGQNGSINATSAAVSAYDFNADLGHQMTAAKKARYGDSNVSSLITEPRATNGWTGQNLRDAILGKQDINLNGHFNHHALLPAAGAPVTTNEIDLSSPGTVLYSIGCHSGLNVFDGYSAAGDNGLERDWPQEKATGGVYVAQTGFGYGSRGSVAMHEWIIREFGKNVHTGWQTAGQSLIFAQNAYLAEGVYDVFDEKVLHTTALYGLPMFRIGANTPPPAPGSTATQTDPISGLQTSNFHLEPNYDAPTTVGDDGTFDSIGGVSVAAAGGPRVAKTPPLDVTNQTLRAHDALPTALVTDEADGRNPLLDYPVLADTALEPEPEVADIVFPDVLPQMTVNRVATPHGDRDRVSTITQQFRSTGFRDDGELEGEIETIRSADGTVFYSNSNDFTRPTADRVEAFVAGNQGSFTIEAHDASDIKRVVVMSRDATGAWRRNELQKSASGTWLGGRQVQGEHLEYCAFIVDGAGNVLPMCDKGRLFDAVEDTGEEPEGINVVINGTPAPQAPWWHVAFVTITPEDPDVTVETSVNGGAYNEHTSALEISEEGFHRVDYRTSDGQSDTILIGIDQLGATAEITSPEDNAKYVLRQNVTPTYSCDGGPSGITQCSGPATVDTSSVGPKTYTVNMTDGAGHISSRVVNYKVVYAFEGYLAPVANEPTLNDPVAGQWVQTRWRLRDATGAQITNPATVTQLRSERVACPGQSAPTPNVETYANSTTYTGGKFEFVWKTKGQWVNTCRNFVLTLNDGTTQTARFKFKPGIVIILYYPGIISLSVVIPT